jgi:hypothetical protein
VIRPILLLAVCTVLSAGCTRQSEEVPGSGAASTTADESKVLFKDDFRTDPLPRWQPVTPSAWRWEKSTRSQAFALTKNVPLKEAVRAPFGRNLIKGLVVGDFRLDVDLQSTMRNYPNRDLCLFFGYRDPAHMYYVHFGKKTSDTANQIFIVNDSDRTPISTHTTAGTPWDDAWHHARVVRTVADGSIKVYFDDMKVPVMTADDSTFDSGQVGIGSFDDTGRFDNVVVRGIIVHGPSGVSTSLADSPEP